MHHVYIDNEFDAVRIDGRNMQQVIALGAVICDARYQEVGRFYSLVRPPNGVFLPLETNFAGSIAYFLSRSAIMISAALLLSRR